MAKQLPNDAEQQLEWLRTRESLPAWSTVMKHFELFRKALPDVFDAEFSFAQRRAAINRWRKTAAQLKNRLLREVGLRRGPGRPKKMPQLAHCYLLWKSLHGGKRPTQSGLARAVAQTRGCDVNDPDSLDEVNATRSIRSVLKREGMTWAEFRQRVEAAEMIEAFEREN
jgi:hypothetical protein